MEMEHAVRRLEWIEAEALTEFHRAATPELKASAGLELHQVDGARVSLMRRGGNIVINRCIGFGLAQPGTIEGLRKIGQIYADAGIERYFLHLSPEGAPQPLTELAERAGLVRDRAWMKFVREDLPVAQRITALEVREIDRDHAADFGRIASAAFGLEAPAAEILAGLVGRSGWHVFMSFDGATPVGTGALFVKDGVAWTDWAATRPEYRRRGSQSALLARRVAVAVDLGCDLIGTCTGEAVPGDEQASYQNLLRCGFEEAGLRENYSPTGRPAGP
ncbi:MAG: GNAT family N-acetyltransferase [Gammaproteobacteria bacterium]